MARLPFPQYSSVTVYYQYQLDQITDIAFTESIFREDCPAKQSPKVFWQTEDAT